MSTCAYVTNLKFVSGFLLVKWWQLGKSLFRWCGWCVTYWQKTDFSDIIKNWEWRHQSTTFVKKTYLGKIQDIISLTWESWSLCRSYREVWFWLENVPKEILITESKFYLNSLSGSSVIKINSGKGVYSPRVNIRDFIPDAQKIFKSKNGTF